LKSSILLFSAAVLTASVAAASDFPSAEGFVGYNWVRFNSSTSNIPGFTGFPSFNLNGGNAQLVYNVRPKIGLVLDVGVVHAGSLFGLANGSTSNGPGVDHTLTNFVLGPRYTFTKHSRWMPFAQALFGGARATSSTSVTVLDGGVIWPPPGIIVPPGTLQPADVTLRAERTGFAMLAGGGLDIKVGRHLALRPIGADYYLVRLPNFVTGNDTNKNHFRYSAGINFLFGGEKPAPAPQANRMQTKTCPDGNTVPVDQACPKQNFSVSLTAIPAEVCQGETVRLTPSFSGVQANQLSHSTWTVNGQQVSQMGLYEFQSEGRAPGTYTLKLTTGGDAFNSASAETKVTVKEYLPPTGTVQANPAQIPAGDSSSISSSFQGQCGGPIQPATYTASEGTVTGDRFDSSSVQWDTSNNAEQRKTITITANASDNRGTGTATTNIEVVRSAVVKPVRLPDVLFTKNNSRVNNCGKRILLEQLRSYWERDSSGTVVLVGHSSSDETSADLSQHRVDNAAAVITAGTGICLRIPASQVQVSAPGSDQNGVSFESSFCESSVAPVGSYTDMRRVEVWYVPSGGQVPQSVTNSQSASTLSLAGLGCPK